MPRAGHDIIVPVRTGADGNGSTRNANGARGDLHNIHIYNVNAVIDANTHVRFYVVDDTIMGQLNNDDGTVSRWEAPQALRFILELTGPDKIPAIGERKTYNPVRRAHNIGGDAEGILRDEYVIRENVVVEVEGVVGIVPPLPDPPDPLPVDYVEPDPLPADKSGQVFLVEFEIHADPDPWG